MAVGELLSLQCAFNSLNRSWVFSWISAFKCLVKMIVFPWGKFEILIQEHLMLLVNYLLDCLVAPTEPVLVHFVREAINLFAGAICRTYHMLWTLWLLWTWSRHVENFVWLTTLCGSWGFLTKDGIFSISAVDVAQGAHFLSLRGITFCMDSLHPVLIPRPIVHGISVAEYLQQQKMPSSS